MVKVAIMGHGVVGSGVAEIMLSHDSKISQKAGEEVQLKYVLDLRNFPGTEIEKYLIHDFDIIENDPEVKVVVETMGGLNPAYHFVKRCLLAGKNVVTSNKELVAAKGAELLAIAKEKNLNFLFEASVGGGIPIIRPLYQCLAANDIIEIAGILNGTTNFILTKMIGEGMTFDEALKLAQSLGYAEKNPEADVEGHDACRKICILASLAYGKHVYPQWVHTEGISDITLDDVRCVEAWGGVIKLIGRVQAAKDGLSMIVCPMFVPGNSQLANISDVFNGILVRGDSVGDVVFYGRGAGKLPTASAVVADVMDCAKHIARRRMIDWEDSKENIVRDYLEDSVSMFIRVEQEPQAMEKIARAFGRVDYIDAGLDQKNEIAFVTGKMPEKDIRIKVRGCGFIVKSMIRVADDL